MTETELTPLYVRLDKDDAERLERAAFESRTSKRALVTGALRQHLGSEGAPVDITWPQGSLEVGRHEFRPLGSALPDVLTLEQAAEFLQVSPTALSELADAGELPGRRIAGEWRFAREALVAWLGAG